MDLPPVRGNIDKSDKKLVIEFNKDSEPVQVEKPNKLEKIKATIPPSSVLSVSITMSDNIQKEVSITNSSPDEKMICRLYIKDGELYLSDKREEKYKMSDGVEIEQVARPELTLMKLNDKKEEAIDLNPEVEGSLEAYLYSESREVARKRSNRDLLQKLKLRVAHNQLQTLQKSYDSGQYSVDTLYDLLKVKSDMAQYKNAQDLQDDDEAIEKTLEIDTDGPNNRDSYASKLVLPGFETGLIAAPQPEGTEKGRRNFCKMLSKHADVVFDLRSANDLGDGEFDYVPADQQTQSRYLDISVEKNSVNRLPMGVYQVGVAIKEEEKEEERQSDKPIDVVQFRSWRDQGVIIPTQLRELRDLLIDAEKKGSVAVHCCTGAGRTGTFLAYVSLYKQLCLLGAGKKFTEREMIDAVMKTVSSLNKQRGRCEIQNSKQLTLIIDTLRGDLKNSRQYTA